MQAASFCFVWAPVEQMLEKEVDHLLAVIASCRSHLSPLKPLEAVIVASVVSARCPPEGRHDPPLSAPRGENDEPCVPTGLGPEGRYDSPPIAPES
eukprot:5636042-Pyramimonas_sp.AAC.1